ncbi:Centromere-associated protein E [Merluccius polli]|uniref:Centromere-associated protein E n=1 Tax=Merluccius polli TaxID=89951 RepID=A0AA47NYM5_MERPO|nr:Centromere-associated protein E [Merluccius polli]
MLLPDRTTTVWCYYRTVPLQCGVTTGPYHYSVFVVLREEGSTESPEPLQLYWKADSKSIHQIEDGAPTKSFSYDRVFSSTETTNHLYQDIAKPLVVSTVEGYNGTIFAYGQTSSGKTFTMMGSDLAPGVIPLSMEEVFQTIKNFPNKEFLLRLSYMEIYNETVTDLLVDSWKRKPLEVRETLNKNIFVADLTEELVTSPSQALAWIRKGEENRHYGKTKMNQRSSRSHTIFRMVRTTLILNIFCMILESRERSDPASGENSDGAIIVSHLNLVDLAGSERASQTGAEGARFKEGCNINRSLFTLAQVIKKLSDESLRGFTNYRDSKLTRILQNSLGGNAKTVIICTITPETMEQTLSTLQFASTAKKMKNDPHVTEVSDDGALLKRYRNEIVDLKRRLHEVSSVTQTTVTEKQTLSQLLQEKDQLQKEQQDRIKNLTKLLVTASTFATAKKKMPKRRVTWGGKLLRLAGTTECDVGQSNLSFAEHFSRKKKAELSSMELLEEDEEFESSCNEMDMNQTGSVSGHSYEDSPQFVSMSGEKVANLEQQLEEERSLREEVLSRASSLEQQLEEERSLREEVLSRASSLEQQVELLAREKREAWEEVQHAEQRAEEQEVQLSAQAQEKQEAREKVEMLELRLADLEENHVTAEPHEQVLAERNHLQQEVVLLLQQVSSLEEQKGFLSQELQEKKEEEEFRALEEDCSKEEQSELHKEIGSLKSTVESWEVKCRDLESQLGSKSQQLVKTSSWVEELESLQGKDLLQQISSLRRSLDDAESLSRDTRKEWAELRSQNLSLKERDVNAVGLVVTYPSPKDVGSVVTYPSPKDVGLVVTYPSPKDVGLVVTYPSPKDVGLVVTYPSPKDAGLSSSHDQMVVEVTGLRSQLEKEKSRFRSMQTDLQKELLMAFEENTKLTTLLDGKVPKNLLENVQLEGTIAALNQELIVCREAESVRREELTVCREAEAALREELIVCREAESVRREELTVCREAEAALREELTVCREAESVRREELTVCREAEAALREELTVCREAESELREELRTAPEQLREQLSSSEQQRSFLEGQLNSLQAEKEALKEDKETLQVEKETLQVEKEALQVDKETLQVEKEALREEKETLKVEIETLREKETLQMETLREEKETLQMETLQVEMETLQEEKETLQVEKETLQEEKETLQVEKETLQEEKETLQEEKETLQVEKETLQEENETLQVEKETLQEEKETLQVEKETLREEKETLREEKETLREEKETLGEEKEALQVENNQLKMDLQENVEMMIENQDELRTALGKVREQEGQIKRLESLPTANQNTPALDSALEIEDLHNQVKCLVEELQEETQKNLENVDQERMSLLDQQVGVHINEVKALSAELQAVSSERDTQRSSSGPEEVERLVSEVAALSQEREQLREEKKQLREEMEDKIHMILQQQQQPSLSCELGILDQHTASPGSALLFIF